MVEVHCSTCLRMCKTDMSTCLSMCMCVIHSDQTCGVRGRHSIVNSRLLQDIVPDVNQRGLGGAVLSLDQEKAFDRRLFAAIKTLSGRVVRSVVLIARAWV